MESYFKCSLSVFFFLFLLFLSDVSAKDLLKLPDMDLDFNSSYSAQPILDISKRIGRLERKKYRSLSTDMIFNVVVVADKDSQGSGNAPFQRAFAA